MLRWENIGKIARLKVVQVSSGGIASFLGGSILSVPEEGFGDGASRFQDLIIYLGDGMLLCLLISAIALFIVTVIYELYCPSEIHEYKEIAKYFEKSYSVDDVYDKLTKEGDNEFVNQVKELLIVERVGANKEIADKLANIILETKKTFMASKKREDIENKWEQMNVSVANNARFAATAFLCVSAVFLILAVLWALARIFN